MLPLCHNCEFALLSRRLYSRRCRLRGTQSIEFWGRCLRHRCHPHVRTGLPLQDEPLPVVAVIRTLTGIRGLLSASSRGCRSSASSMWGSSSADSPRQKTGSFGRSLFRLRASVFMRSMTHCCVGSAFHLSPLITLRDLREKNGWVPCLFSRSSRAMHETARSSGCCGLPRSPRMRGEAAV